MRPLSPRVTLRGDPSSCTGLHCCLRGHCVAQGGALYALGLIYANHGHSVRPFLLECLRGTSNETVQHGACLGLGEPEQQSPSLPPSRAR